MLLLNYICAKVEVLRAMRDDERGVTALEYGLIAALIAVVIIVSLTYLGTSLRNMFQGIANTVNSVSTAP